MPVEEMSGAFLTKLLEKSLVWLTDFSLPMIASYHLLVENTIINEVRPEAMRMEKIADTLLAPFHFVFAGRGQGSFRFDYDSHLLVKSTASLLTLPLSTAVGLPLKIFASPVKTSAPPISLTSLRFGSAIEEALRSPIYARRPGDEHNLVEEKAALREIARVFKKYEIPFWVDCGTCLGVYRHRGAIPWDVDIDLAILEPDHTRAKMALQELDPQKYQVQDWSNRSRPGTYLRLYVKASRALIDIYHFAIDEENQTLHYILSNEVSAFLPASWKKHESRFKIPTPISVIFPLRRETFDGIEVFAPNKTKEYLQMRYGEDLSPARIYNEQTGEYEKNLSHPYWNS